MVQVTMKTKMERSFARHRAFRIIVSHNFTAHTKGLHRFKDFVDNKD